MYEVAVRWSGMVLVGAVVVALLLFAYSVACVATAKLFERVRWDAYSRATRDIGNRLVTESYWFSEDRDVSLALEIVGKRYLTEVGDVGTCRDEWRRRKSEKVS